MKYQANPVIVDAFKIVDISATKEDGTMDMALENGENVTAAPEMLVRIPVQPGDYWVVQDDGYIYLNPKAVFERKYSPVQEA